MVKTNVKIHSLGQRGGHINVEYIKLMHPARAAARAMPGFIQSEDMLS